MDLSFLPLMLPLGVLTATAVLVLLLDVFAPADTDPAGGTGNEGGGGVNLRSVTLAGLLIAALATILLGSRGYVANFVALNPAIAFAAVVALGAAAASVLMAEPYIEANKGEGRGEYYALVVLAAAAMHLLCMATELITIFIAIEMIGLCLYVLAGFESKDLGSREAAFKYFMLAAFASTFLLMGIALVYGATGSTVLPHIRAAFSANELNVAFAPWAMVGLALMFVGFAFKLTFAPFHMYASDVYAGAPMPSASLIATGSKVAGFMALANVVLYTVVPQLGTEAPRALDATRLELGDAATALLMIAAILSMIVGNLGAFVQTNLKRLLAYSSIAHAGYLALGFAALAQFAKSGDSAAQQIALDAIVYYLMAYTAMTVLAFAVLSLLGETAADKRSLAGLGSRSPVLAFALAIAMISLTGIPPTVGFFGKFMVFMAAVNAGFVEWALLGVALSILSAYYYLHVIVVMFFEKAEPGRPGLAPLDVFTRLQPTAQPLVVAGTLLVVAGGLFLLP